MQDGVLQLPTGDGKRVEVGYAVNKENEGNTVIQGQCRGLWYEVYAVRRENTVTRGLRSYGRTKCGRKSQYHIMQDQYIYVKFYYTKSERPMHPCAPYDKLPRTVQMTLGLNGIYKCFKHQVIALKFSFSLSPVSSKSVEKYTSYSRHKLKQSGN